MRFKALLISFLAILTLAWVQPKDLFEYPEHFPKPVYDFSNNELTQEKINLGRALFYEPTISANNRVSCATCHSSFNGFAHTDHDVSHGIFDSIGDRNAPALFNLAWQENFMWDGAINHLDMQALAPISHEDEMAENIENVVAKLNENNIYKNLFYRAYNDSFATGEKVLKALSQFQTTIVSANSKYDKVQQGFETYSPQEKNGYLLYQQNCSSCHVEPLFSSYEFANNGLPIDTFFNDYGVGAITMNSSDSLKFKIPSLRNLSYTYPYMHDGRFNKLKEVIDHYLGLNPNDKGLDNRLSKQIELTDNEQIDLIVFLLTLNDKDFVFEPKFQYPKQILRSTEGN